MSSCISVSGCAVDLGRDELAHDVVGRLAPALLDQLTEVGVHLHARAPNGLVRASRRDGGTRGRPCRSPRWSSGTAAASRSRGTPRIHEITPIGSGAAMRSTKSNSSPPLAATGCRRGSRRAMRSISSWRDRMARGVNRRIATRRSGPCRGGSRVTTISIGWPALRAVGPERCSPCSFEKRSGCDATSGCRRAS